MLCSKAFAFLLILMTNSNHFFCVSVTVMLLNMVLAVAIIFTLLSYGQSEETELICPAGFFAIGKSWYVGYKKDSMDEKPADTDPKVYSVCANCQDSNNPFLVELCLANIIVDHQNWYYGREAIPEKNITGFKIDMSKKDLKSTLKNISSLHGSQSEYLNCPSGLLHEKLQTRMMPFNKSGNNKTELFFCSICSENINYPSYSFCVGNLTYDFSGNFLLPHLFENPLCNFTFDQTMKMKPYDFYEKAKSCNERKGESN